MAPDILIKEPSVKICPDDTAVAIFPFLVNDEIEIVEVVSDGLNTQTLVTPEIFLACVIISFSLKWDTGFCVLNNNLSL